MTIPKTRPTSYPRAMLIAGAGGFMLRGPQVTYAPEGDEGGGGGEGAPADTTADAGGATEGAPAGEATTEGGGLPNLLGGDSQPGSDTVAGGDTLTGSDTVAGDTVAGDDKDALNLVGAPEGDYVLTLPEGEHGMVLDEAALALAAPVLKELNISQEGAQALMGKLYVPLVSHIMDKANSAALEQQAATITTWAKEAPADPRFGGAEGFREAMTHANKAYDQFVGEDARVLFEASGLGNRPEIIELFSKVGQAMGEGTFHRTDTTNSKPKDLGEAFFPGFNQGQPQE